MCKKELLSVRKLILLQKIFSIMGIIVLILDIIISILFNSTFILLMFLIISILFLRISESIYEYRIKILDKR